MTNLLPNHLADLRRSGLTDDTIAAVGFYSETHLERLATILNRKQYPGKWGAALVIPFRGTDGRNGYHRVKPDTPPIRDGRPAKYLSPSGSPNQVFVPPGTFAVLADPTAHLLLTESEKKACAADQVGFRCLGLTGVWSWKEAKSERLVSELERVAWRGRRVWIAFDSDMAAKPEIEEAANRLAAVLENHGAIIRIVRIPNGPTGLDGKPTKWGVDDFLVAHGTAGAAEFQKLLESADEPGKVHPGTIKIAAADVDPYPEARRLLASQFSKDGSLTIHKWRDEWYAWNGTHYELVPDSEVQAGIARWLEPGVFNLNRSVIANIQACLAAECIVPSRTEMPSWFDGAGPWDPFEVLATKSGLLHLPSLVDRQECLVPPTPRFFSSNSLGYSFDPEATCETWLRFLPELWQEDSQSIDLLQEWFGYCLLPDTRQQKILLLVGPKRSGKGTIARVLRGLVGADNVAGPTLASLGLNFGLWPLLGKTVAIVSDARLSRRSDEAQVAERLLSLSGEDALTVDRKNLTPITTRLKARLLILTNELPRFSDASGALASRMLILPLTRSWYGCEDPGLSDRLLGELPGILLWSIRGWERLRDRGHFEAPETSRDLACELEDLASPVGAFIRDMCSVGPDCETPIQDVFAAWCGWSSEHGRREHGTEQVFGRDLRAAVPSLRVRQPRDGEDRVRVYRGIGLSADGLHASSAWKAKLARDGTRVFQ